MQPHHDGMADVQQALGLEPGGALALRDLQMLEWGKLLRLDAVYRLDGHDAQTLTLRFLECRELKWRVYAFDDGRDEVALVDARLGRGGHRSPAHLLTDRFGLTLFYGELAVDLNR